MACPFKNAELVVPSVDASGPANIYHINFVMIEKQL